MGEEREKQKTEGRKYAKELGPLGQDDSSKEERRRRSSSGLRGTLDVFAPGIKRGLASFHASVRNCIC